MAKVKQAAEQVKDGLIEVEVATVLPLTSRSFAMRVQGESMLEAGIYAGDVVVAEASPLARPGELVIALVDGEPVLRRLVMHRDRPHLVRAHPAGPAPIPVSDLVIQGVVQAMVRKMTGSK
jgi:repressor LexA